MSLNRAKTWLIALGLQLLLAAGAAAQAPPFAPAIGDAQIWMQPDYSTYSGPLRRPEGYFGSIEGLVWSISTPPKHQIGVDGGARPVYGSSGFSIQTNSADTNWITASLQSGTRFDFGVIDDDRGWLFSAFRLYNYSNDYLQSNASVVFNEPFYAVSPAGFGPATLPALYGFIDQVGGNPTATNRGNPDGFADDVNRNNVYGPQGRDRGVVTGNVLTPGTTLDGIPDREGGAETVTVPYGAGGPPPGSAAQVNANIPIDYNDAVPLPLIFTTLQSTYRNSLYGVEANRLYRLGVGRLGGGWELFGGVRYFSFSDQFNVIGLGGILGDSFWDTKSDNRLVGPQLGLRYDRTWGRWSFNGQARVAPTANFQSIRQNGVIGSQLTQVQAQPPANPVANPPIQPNNPGTGPSAFRLNQPLNLQRTAFTSGQNATTFSPIVELRLNLTYQLFQSVKITSGYTGMYLDGLARSTNVVDYSLPSMGILSNHNISTAFVNGFNIGVEVNR